MTRDRVHCRVLVLAVLIIWKLPTVLLITEIRAKTYCKKNANLIPLSATCQLLRQNEPKHRVCDNALRVYSHRTPPEAVIDEYGNRICLKGTANGFLSI